jgi:hypothetical protein
LHRVLPEFHVDRARPQQAYLIPHSLPVSHPSPHPRAPSSPIPSATRSPSTSTRRNFGRASVTSTRRNSGRASPTAQRRSRRSARRALPWDEGGWASARGGRDAGVLLGRHGALALDSAAALAAPRGTLPMRPWRVAAARCGHGSG